MVSFAGRTSKSYQHISAGQFIKLRRIRGEVIDALNASLDQSAKLSTGDTRPWATSVSFELSMLVDLNATESLPRLKKLAEQVLVELSSPDSMRQSGSAETAATAAARRLTVQRKAQAQERMGDLLSAIVAILRQERFEPLRRSQLEKEAEASFAKWNKNDWSVLLRQKIEARGGEIPPEYRDSVFIDPFVGQPMTLWTFDESRVESGTIWQILRWVDEYGKAARREEARREGDAALARRSLSLAAAVIFLSGCVAPAPNGHDMVRVAAGSYRVGAEGSSRNPRRHLRVAAFEIATAETTNAQFSRFVDVTGYVTDAEREGVGMVFEEGMIDWQWRRTPGACWRNPFGDDRFTAITRPDDPVTQISAADASAYCAWTHLRLPTIVEWEVAARAGSDTLYPWGDKLDSAGVAMCNVWEGKSHLKDDTRDGFLYLAPVKSYPPNRWGLFDVIGNVFEYCADGVSASSPELASHLTTVRGGSWWCSATACNAYNLVDIGQMDRHASFANQGFRVAR